MTARGLIDFLPAALNLPRETLNQTFQHNLQNTQPKQDQETTQKAAFTPHAMILTRDGARSNSTLISALVNSRRYLRIDFPEDVQAKDYVSFAFKEIENKKDPVHQFYDGITGISINYSFGHARTFNL